MPYRYVGYHYAAESLLLLNRYDEALQYLNPEVVGNLEVTSPSTREYSTVALLIYKYSVVSGRIDTS